MKNKLSFFLLSAFIIISQAGCLSLVQKNQFLKDDFQTQSILIPMTLLKVDIIDRRKPTKNNDLQVPNFSMPGKHTQADAILTEELKMVIQSEIVRYFSGTGSKVRARAELLKGTQSFSSKWTGEKEQVDCSVRVTLIDIVSNQAFVSGEGQATYWVESVDASKVYLDKLFAKALRASLYKSMESIDSAIKN